jgi:hypothetical protein
MLPWWFKRSSPAARRPARARLDSPAALPRARGRRDTETDTVQFAQAALAAAKQEGLQLAVRGRSTHVAQDDVSRHPIGDRCVAAIGTFETCRHCIERCLLFRGNSEDICSHWVLLSWTRNRPQTYKVPAGPARFHSDLDCQLAAIVYQFWLVGARGNGGWGRAKPIAPGGASMLALRVSTLSSVVRNAAITAITKAVAKTANTVRWVFI